MTEALKSTEGGRKRLEEAEERADKFFEKLSEKMDGDGEKEANRMKKDEVAKDEDMEWQELADNIKRKKKQFEDVEREAKRRTVEDDLNQEKMEVDVGEMDLIDEPDTSTRPRGGNARSTSLT